MKIVQIIAETILFIITAFILFVTIRLSGHTESAGIPTIGLVIINLVVLIVGGLGHAFRIVRTNHFLIFVAVLIFMFSSFVIFHRTYDSYNETRSIFWGLNGE